MPSATVDEPSEALIDEADKDDKDAELGETAPLCFACSRSELRSATILNSKFNCGGS